MTKTKHRIVINITSLIDVLFLLLIFFIVSSTFLEQPGMKLNLPKTSGGKTLQMKGYTLFITSDGSMFLNEEQISMKQLPDRLKTIASDVKNKGLILKADENTKYGLVVEAMDIAKQSGITKLIVATRIKSKK